MFQPAVSKMPISKSHTNKYDEDNDEVKYPIYLIFKMPNYHAG